MSELGKASRNRVIGRSVGRVGLELKYARVRPSALSVFAWHAFVVAREPIRLSRAARKD